MRAAASGNRQGAAKLFDRVADCSSDAFSSSVEVESELHASPAVLEARTPAVLSQSGGGLGSQLETGEQVRRWRLAASSCLLQHFCETTRSLQRGPGLAACRHTRHPSKQGCAALRACNRRASTEVHPTIAYSCQLTSVRQLQTRRRRRSPV